MPSFGVKFQLWSHSAAVWHPSRHWQVMAPKKAQQIIPSAEVVVTKMSPIVCKHRLAGCLYYFMTSAEVPVTKMLHVFSNTK